MVTGLLKRGMLVGLLAGLLAFGFGRILVEPSIDRAIAFEDQMRHAKGEVREPALVSRQTQKGLGLLTGVIVYGVALGGIFSLMFAAAFGRIGRIGPRATAALLGLAGFFVVVLIPALKYPPNPPAVGDPQTIGYRTALYFTMIALSLASSIVAAVLAPRLIERLGVWNGIILAVLVFVFAIGVSQAFLPTVGEVPDGFSAVLLWRFRIGSLGLHAVLWATLGIGFGMAAEKFLPHGAARRGPPRRASLARPSR